MSSGGRPALRRALGALAGAAAGATAWISLGVVAVVDGERLTRVVAAPPLTWLAALAALGAAAGMAGRWPGRAVSPLALLVLPWLPWLPFRVPASWLLWDGPLEGAVWIAALSGVAWETWRARRPVSAPAASGRSGWPAPLIAGLLMAVVAGASWLVARPRVPSGDEPHYLVITQSLLRDGDLKIENNHRDGQYLAYFDGALKPDFMRRGLDRQIYSIHAPGASALVLPAFALGGYPGAVLTVIAVVAGGVAALWLAAFRLTGSAGGAWVSALALITAAPYVLLAFMIYPDPLGSAVTAAVLLALVTLETGGGWSGGGWLALGAALAVLPWLHTRFAVLAGAAGLVLAWRAWQAGRLPAVVRLLAVPAVSAVGWFAYFRIIYGHPDPGAPYGVGTGSGLAFVPQGLAGLLVDQQFGLVANAPVLAAGLAGLVLLAWQRPRLAGELLVIALPYLATAAAFPMWWGGYSSPARFAIVLTPVLALPVGLLWARGPVALRAAVAVVVAVSALLTAAMVGVDRGALIYNGRDGHALILDWLSSLVDLTLAAPSVLRDGVGGGLAAAGVWAVAIASVVVWAARFPRLGRSLAWVATPVVVMAATTVVAVGGSRRLVTPPTSEMRFLAAWRDGLLPLAGQITPTRRLDAAEVVGRLQLETTTRGELPTGEAPLLQVPSVPAGDYDVFIEADGDPRGVATLRIGRQGRTELPVARWQLDGLRAGYGGLTVRLPVDVHSVTVAGDGPARLSVRRLALRPRSLGASAGGQDALRAARFGGVVVYALDDYAYLEPGAFWTRGERTARVVVQGDAGVAPVMRLKAGPVATEVRLSAGSWSSTLQLAPDASADVPLPPAALAPQTLAIDTRQGFRPSAHGGDDVRWLGVYVTWPDVAVPGTR